MDIKFIFMLNITTALLLFFSILQLIRHTKRLKTIKYRVHVNGTRGKSSVTRLIAAGLRAGGLKTCAKTTGTVPRMIMPDGREYPIFRPGRPNIAEQLRVVRTAKANNVEVLVMECMALQPYLQWLSEDKMIKATHGVITNARADHLDVMGPNEEDVVKALCGMVPKNRKLFTAERKYLEFIQLVCHERKTECVSTTLEKINSVTEDELTKFQYIEHAENVALALEVCCSLGVSRDVALKGMQKASPDPGALIDYDINFFGRSFRFVNGFAANDPESTQRVWDISIERHPEATKRIALFNCRVDRPERSMQLAQAFKQWAPADHIVIMGTGTYLFSKTLTKAGFNYHDIYFADNLSVEEIFESIVELSGPSALIVGMGNIGGQGLELVQFFKNRALLKEEA